MAMALESPWRSPRLQKRATSSKEKTSPELNLPQVTLKSEESPKTESKPKKMSRAMREREAARQINEYRKNILEKVNKECINYREAMAKEQEEKRNTTISFNRKKEVLEFCKKFQLPSRSQRASAEPQVKDYEIKSALRGSSEVYVGRVASKRTSILGNFHINEETVPELQSEDSTMQKPPEEIPLPPPKKSPRNSPKPSPKASPKTSVEKKKDKPDKPSK